MAVKRTAFEIRSVPQTLLLTLPMALWALLMTTPVLSAKQTKLTVCALATAVFMTVLFGMMVRTGATYRWRRIFFVALGFLFPVEFIYELISMRGSMSLPIEQMLAGQTPFCFMPIPYLIVPAVFTRTII